MPSREPDPSHIPAEDSPSREATFPAFADHLQVVLVRPEHAGNIGAAARAMKNMGVSVLRLVAPRCGHLTPDALKMAYGARDILEHARLHAELPEALADSRWVVGFALPRPGRPPCVWMEHAAVRIVARAGQGPVALVFGSEISGLSHDELARCDEVAAIGTAPAQPSLNLAQTVLLACYAVRQAAVQPPAPLDDRQLATQTEIEALHADLGATLAAIGFLKPPHDRHILRDLRALMHRAHLDSREVRLIRGILRRARWARRAPR